MTRKQNGWAILTLLLMVCLASNGAAAEKYFYDNAGRLTRVEYGGGVILAYTYNPAGTITNETVTSPVGFSFPFLHADANSYTGVAASNFSDRTARLQLTGLGQSGSALPFANNPSSVVLDPGKQMARLGHEIFGIASSTPENGWIKMISDNADISSIFLTGTNFQLDGSVPSTQQSKRLFFTRVLEGSRVFRGQSATTTLSIANPNDQPITIKLNIYGPVARQTLAGEKVETIPARGLLYKTLSRIFGIPISASQGFVDVEVTQGEGAVGFESVQFIEQETILGLNAVLGNSANESYSAQLAHGQLAPGQQIYTDVKLLNVGQQTRAVTVRATREDGSALGTPARLNLASGQLIQEDAGTLLGLGPITMSPAAVGSLRVEADGPDVVGDVLFGDPLFNYATALPMQTQTFTKAVFSQVANSLGYFTGLALFYPGIGAAIVDIEVFSEDGILTGSATLFLEGGKRLSKLLTELVPSTAGQLRGYIVVRSTLPLVAQVLFGDTNLSFLSAVPPLLSPTIRTSEAAAPPPPPTAVARGALDTPTNGQTVTGTLNGGGWALFVTGNTGALPARVEMLIDDTVAAQATLGVSRTDVRDFFAGQGITVPANAGFSFSWNSAAVSAGPHALSIRAADAAGTTRELVSEIARITINVAVQTPSCGGLFSDNFDRGNFDGWTAANGVWQVLNGKFQVSGMTETQRATATHSLPVPGFFRLTHDVEAVNFNGALYGGQAYSTTQTFQLNLPGSAPVLTNGLGAGVNSSGRVGFLGFDVNAGTMFLLNSTDYGPVSNLGLEWTSTAIRLIVNGTVRQTLNVTGGSTLSLDLFRLVASGDTSTIRFDNICHTSPAGAVVGDSASFLKQASPFGIQTPAGAGTGIPASTSVIELHNPSPSLEVRRR